MDTNRRDFLKGTAWMGAAAVAAGCMSDGAKLSLGAGTMQGFAPKALKKIRVGVAGLGMRGPGAVHRLSAIPGVEVAALCDLHAERVAIQQKWLKDNGKPAAKEYVGKTAYKAMCDSDLDVIYNATSWDMHVPIALCAMDHGKHALVEVPSATTLEDCWALVETSERTKRICMQLENCCYGETEMLCLNLCRKGLLGELVHGEGAYIHDLRSLCYQDPIVDKPWGGSGYNNYWRLRHNVKHKGNQYETHGLGPICQNMNVNRGDRFDYLVSLESNQFNFEAYGKAVGDAQWKKDLRVAMGDMNTTLIKTVLGRSIMIQHDVSSPRPYSRINKTTGTLGIFADYPYRVALAKKPGDPCHSFFGEKEAEAVRQEHMHPLWKRAGEFAKKVGGHGGMDFLMDLRWCYCLQNGLPFDFDVYDLAAWCSLGELTEKSVRNRSCSMDVPDFTRGGWKTAKPLGIVDVDLAKMGDWGDAKKDATALSV
ncbi:MAG: Gfo/Idh/MocA family oxidoreductase [Kiritimatiellae bacterium]|nr:Gfo/Idh/MocA family oxidoreductase [Kiritimatiellia bacterium]